MDTRDKIITADRAAVIVEQARGNGSEVKIVTGHFDVLLAGHVCRLREIGAGAATLFVLILDPPMPVLGLCARAELVAALTVVDYVVPAVEQAAGELLSHFREEEIVKEESADLLRAHWLSEHVQRRHRQ